MGAATGALLPLRNSLSLAAAALVFVLPVVGAMLLGGARVGLLGVVLGFVVLDVVFIPPYGTLTVAAGRTGWRSSSTSQSSFWSRSSCPDCSN